MEKTRKGWKMLVLLVALAVVSSSIAGCGDSKTAAKATDKTNTAAQTTITVGTTGLTPGMSEEGSDKNKDGGVQGADIDIVNEIAKRNNWKVQWKVAPIDALFGMLDNGGVNTLANCIATNKKREEKYNFAQPYAYGSYSLVAKKNSAKVDSLQSLKGRSCAVLAAADQRISLEDMNEKEKLGMKIVPIDNNAAVLQTMLNGTTELAYIGTTSAALAAKSLKLDLQIYDPGIRNYKLAHPFLKKPEMDKIREKFNSSLEAMRKDGTLKKIFMKWYGLDLSVQPGK